MKTAIGFEARLDGPFHRAIGRVKEALRAKGFGVLTEIDVKGTLAEKLGVDFRRYSILGACNPRLAHRALSIRSEVGLVLPCNVTVEEDDDGSVTVRIIDPEAIFAAGRFEPDPAIAEVVDEARELLSDVAASLSDD